MQKKKEKPKKFYVIRKAEKVNSQVFEKMTALIIAAFGLVAALAWNEAIKAIFTEIFGKPDGLGPLLTYAIIVTVLAVMFTLILSKMADKADVEQKK